MKIKSLHKKGDSVKPVTAPTITIDYKCEAMIKEWVKLCDKEISGLGKVIRGEDGSLHVHKVYLLTQEVSAAETELDGDAVATLLYETRDVEGELSFWWHSHVDMAVFWSGTDMDTIYQFGKNGALLSAVYNKQDERRVSLYVQGAGYHPTVFLDELEMHTTNALDDATKEFCKAEFEEKVTEQAFSYSYKGMSYAGWDDDYDYDYDYLAPTKKEESIDVIDYSDSAMANFGVPKQLIKQQSQYYKLILTKWFRVPYKQRLDWADAYYDWHGKESMEATKILVKEKAADIAEFADSFNFDLREYDVDILTGGGVK